MRQKPPRSFPKPLGRLPKIAVCCPTYGRPTIIPTLVGCFARQNYPSELCELIVLDDGGQLVAGNYSFQGKSVRVHVTGERHSTLGAKRNKARSLVSADVDAVCFWDDDDIYLPWALEAIADRIHQTGIALASWAYVQDARRKIKVARRMFHTNCGFLLSTFDAAGGYPEANRGEDTKFLSNWVTHRGHGYFPRNLNTIDNFYPYLLVRRGLRNTYHTHWRGFNYENAFKMDGDRVAIHDAELPAYVKQWADSLEGKGWAGRKHVSDLVRDQSKYLPCSNMAEWHLTYACDLNCANCNRLCFLPPKTPPMTLDDAREFVQQAERMNWRPKIMILGGEPTLNCDLLAFIEIANRLSPGRVVVWSNGYSDKTKKVLQEVEKQGLAAIKTATQKPAGSVVHKCGDMFLAPIDFGMQDREPCDCHAAGGRCGISVDRAGYTLCPSGGMIDAVFGLGLRTKNLADLFDPGYAERQTKSMCRQCGFRLGITTDKIAKSTIVGGSAMSPSWLEAINEH